MADRLLLFGYIRETETQITSIIPYDVVILIQMFMMKYKIFGVGRNRLGELGLRHDQFVTSFTRLLLLEDLLPNIDNIYCNRRGIMVKTSQNELFVSGGLTYGNLETTAHESCIFTQVNKTGLDAIKLCSKGPENNYHTFILCLNGDLYANGSDGSHGRYATDKRFHAFQQISTDFCRGDDIIDIRCGNGHSVFLTQSGMVYCCGSNHSAECGVNIDIETVYIPRRICMKNIGEDTKVTAITVGYCHNLAIDEYGRLIVWGNNFSGALGVGDQWNNKWSYLPMINTTFEQQIIEQIESGYGHSLVRNNVGQCYAFGNNTSGSIGNGIARDSNIFKPHFIEIPGNKGDYVVDGACGEQHTVLLSKENNVITFGDNSYQQCSPLHEDTSKPYVVSKSKELSIAESAYVEKVFCLNFETIIIVNPMKNKD